MANIIGGYYNPPIPFSYTDTQKLNAPLMSQAKAEINNNTNNHEIMQVRLDWAGSALTQDTQVKVWWFNPDNQVVYTYTTVWKRGWTHAWIASWIGHKTGEIDKPGTYRAEINAPGFFKSKEFHIESKVTDPNIPGCVITPREHYKKLTIYYKPFSSLVAPYSFIIPPTNYVGGGIAALSAKLPAIQSAINNALPDGWTLTEVKAGNKELSFTFKEVGTPAIPIAVIVAIVAGVLILIGLIIGAWKLIDYYKEKEQTYQLQLEEEISKTKADLARDLVDAGFNAEDTAKIVDSIYTPSDDNGGMLDEFKDIILYLVAGMAIIMLVQQMAQSRKK